MDAAKIAVCREPNGQIGIESVTVPEIGPEGVLLRVERAGICASDAHMYAGAMEGLPFPIVLGHELVGVVVQTGLSEDSMGQPLSIGDRVIPMPAVACGKCSECLVGGYRYRCQNITALGFMGIDHPLSGGWAQYVILRPGQFFIKTELPPENAVLLEPLCTPLGGLEAVGIRPDDYVVIQGSGAVGLLALLVAMSRGARHCAVIGGPAPRLELASILGAELTIDVAGTTADERFARTSQWALPTRGATVVVECAGAPNAVPEGLSYLANGGRYAELGNFTDNGSTTINPFRDFMRRNVTLIARSGYDPRHWVMGHELLSSYGDRFSSLVTHQEPLERVEEVIHSVLEHRWELDGRVFVKATFDPWL